MDKEEISEKNSTDKAINKKKIRIVSALQLKNKILKNLKKYCEKDEVDEAFKYLNNKKLLEIIHKKFSKKNILNTDTCRRMFSEDSMERIDFDDDSLWYDSFSTQELRDIRIGKQNKILFCSYSGMIETMNSLNEGPLIELNRSNNQKNLKDYEDMLRHIFKEAPDSSSFVCQHLEELINNFNDSILTINKEKYIKLLKEIFTNSQFYSETVGYFSEIIAELNKSPLSEDLDKYETILRYIILEYDDYDNYDTDSEEIKLLNKKIKNPDNYYNILKNIYDKKDKTYKEMKRINCPKRTKLLKSLKDSNEEENFALLNNFLNQ
jgi:hypothetical protein